jgi:propionate CoA-transferase
MACLGLAEADREGNVNVSRFGARLAGAGGFINISQTARRLVFAGTFTAGGLDVAVQDGRLIIAKEGRSKKFHDAVEQITFSGRRASVLGQPVLYVTERCVFELGVHGLKLTEVAPGVDIERDIVAHMAFRPLIGEVRPMLPAIFDPAPMGLRERLLDIALEDRFHHDAERGILFLNFRHLRVKTEGDVERIRLAVHRHCEPLGRKVAGVVSYDGFQLDEAVAPAYAAMVQALEQRFYTRVTRYAGGAFDRLRLAQAIHREIGPAVLGAGVSDAAAAQRGGV